MPPQAGPPGCSYVLGTKLAAGGMAEVFEARCLDRHFGTPIVIKRMRSHLAGDRDFVTMFIDEARLCARLDHPNIVKVYDFEATDQGLSLVMELIDGPNLMTVLKSVAAQKKRVPVELAAFIVCHVLEALDYAHNVQVNSRRLDVVHRDVSPSNILFTRRGGVKLADFGIARAAERQHETAGGTLKGKYAYMSPEQISGGTIDGRSDLFSTGIVLAEMLMGKRLFTGPSDLELLLKVRQADLSRYDQYAGAVPVEVDAILRKALCPQPAHRFESAAAMRDALLGYLATSTRRSGSTELANYLQSFEQAEEGGAVELSSAVMSGTQTRLARSKLRKAAVAGRHVFALGASPRDMPPLATALWEDVSLESFDSPVTGADTTPTHGADWLTTGSLASVHPIDLLCEIYQRRHTGLLVLKSGEQIKELYFVNGHPEFVRSNVHSDRFGQFLVAQGMLTEAQLHRVLASLPHFDGRMGRALVALELVNPVDAVRLLGQQITHKITDTFYWRTGNYSFREGYTNQWPAEALQLNTVAIVSQGLDSLPKQVLVDWVGRHRHDRLIADTGMLDELGFSGRTAKLIRLFGGKHTLEAILTALPKDLDMDRFLALTYALTRCRAISYSARVSRQTVPTLTRATHLSATVSADRNQRRFPRVKVNRPATLELCRAGFQPTAVTLCSVTCNGLGLRFAEGAFARMRRGDQVRVRFRNGGADILVQGRVAWATEDKDEEIHLGLHLDHALVPAAMRESFARWSAALLINRD